MEITLENNIEVKLSNLTGKFKLSKAEDLIMKMLDMIPKSETIYYIGEYNKNDSMF